MWATSGRWDDAVRTSHRVVVLAQVWRAGTYTGSDVVLTGGTIRADESSAVRRHLTAQSSDVDLMPRTATDLLNPVDT
ncbi:MAG: hypothetical protein M3067_10845, partial [Chloroflexota bacterium]|nr:hypothetical protein [Chloroflexota bacterium]